MCERAALKYQLKEDVQAADDYWRKKHGTVFPFLFATCVKSVVEGQLRLTHILPRMFPLRLSKGVLYEHTV
jgi:hypothetical protein